MIGDQLILLIVFDKYLQHLQYCELDGQVGFG